jgi:hypothetical protein
MEDDSLALDEESIINAGIHIYTYIHLSIFQYISKLTLLIHLSIYTSI